MPLRSVRLVSICAAVAVILPSGAATAQSSPPVSQSTSPSVAGVWVLNPALTQKPDEVGFGTDWGGAGGESGGRSGGGRGRRGGSGGGGMMGAPPIMRESADDSTRKQQLTGEARTPPGHITIVQNGTSVMIADDQGHTRTFHPTGNLEELTIGTVALPTTARWDEASLVVVYEVENGRQLRYRLTPTANPARLLVDIRFIDHGREGDEVQLTYEPPDEHDRAVLAGTGAPAAPAPATPAASAPAVAGAPPATAARATVLPPGSELRGLTTINTVVDDLSAQAAACGLDQAKIKTSVARTLTDAGFKSQAFGNEETYVLVSIATNKLPDGTCVSRYDASLISQADATLPYVKGLVALEVPLLHEGGLTGGPPAAHASAVLDALTKSIASFVSQIRAANK